MGEVNQEGLKIRREMFGPEGAEKQLEAATDFTRPFQEVVTNYCFGETWTRPHLDRRTRSMITVALLTGMSRPQQLKHHVKGAIANGVTKDEIREIIMHTAVYCGIPAGADNMGHAVAALQELGLE
jgi:4-carboxymuconolactone decarboxylase